MSGVGQLVRLFLRRDRWMLLWWGLGTMLLYVSQAISVDGLYATQAEFDRAAASMENNAAFIAMAGPARALNTIGGQVTWQATAFGAIVAGLMSMFLVARHTRVEEETGRDELLRAAAIGRQAPMIAALLTAMIANALLGTMVAVSLVAYPLAVADSLGLGVGLMLVGWVFSATALLAAQLTSTSRAMYGIAGSVLGVAYVLRAIGDLGTPALTWLSPIGWYQAMHAFSGLRWWPAFLLVAAAALTTAAAYAIFERRDFGDGVFAARPGPAAAGPGLRTGWGLVWRQHRGPVLGWAIGLFLVGLAYGSMGTDVADLVGDSQASQDLFVQAKGDLIDGFYATALLMLALIVSGYAISSAQRPRAEEEAGRVEALLATALPRQRWWAAHVSATVVGVVLVTLAAGLGLGAGFALATGDGGALLRYPSAMMGYVAPVLVLSALARLLYGLAPRASVVAWLGLVLAVVVMLFGDLFGLPQWLQDLSPFEHLALVPAEEFRWAPFLALLAVAAVLSTAGRQGFVRRDVA
ncbi:ABC transporter permease [Nocardioides sp.]|uniref:ABC transporter permease n=1 Tax=Nocardioides sp. TaxID=35761 RepID=UPI003D0B8DDC